MKFYNFWENFQTKKTFSWTDKWNPSEGPTRMVIILNEYTCYLYFFLVICYYYLIYSIVEQWKKRIKNQEKLQKRTLNFK